MNDISDLFGDRYKTLKNRIDSYDFLETFLDSMHSDWSKTPDTAYIVIELQKALDALSIEDLAFLICHSGYIPETYPRDSSQETLYTKLVETIVLEWSKRVGFDQSLLPTQKASKEDVTLLDHEVVIVCDAKAFRLGRSQAAPNVKDVLKHSDIKKWLSQYPDKKQLGGLVTFPSQLDWKVGSDLYQYTTDKSSPTICLYYEHMSFMLLNGMTKESLIDSFEEYPSLFPTVIKKSDRNRSKYYDAIEGHLFRDHSEDWKKFRSAMREVVSERVYHCMYTLAEHVKEVRSQIEDEFHQEQDINKLREIAIESTYEHATEELHKQLDRISRFRDVAGGYSEDQE